MTPLELMRLLYTGAVTQGFAEFRLIQHGQGTKQVFMPWPIFDGHPDVFTLDQVPAGYSPYFGLSLRKDSSSGKAENCKPTRLVWQDFDLKGTPYVHGQTDVLNMAADELREAAVRLYADVLEKCEGLSLPPRLAVYTGHGLQLCWAREVSSSPEDTRRFNEALAAEFGAEMGADVKTKDVARVFRVPGSQNLKNPDRPLLVEAWHQDPDAYVKEEALERVADGHGLGVTKVTVSELQRQRQRAAQKKAAPAPQKGERLKGKTPEERAAERRAREVAAALAGEVQTMRNASDGQRNDTLNICAVKLGRFVPHGELSEAEVIEALTEAAQAAGLEDGEIRDTIRSGLSKGTQEPADPQRYEDEERQKGEQPRRGSNLQAAAKRIAAPEEARPTADEIPDPEGEGGTYSDQQVRELLGITWPVVAVDTEKAHAHRLRELAGDDLGYVAELGGYVAWNGRQWLSGGKEGAGQVEARRRVQGLGVAMQPEVELLLTLYSRLDVAAKRLAREEAPDSPELKAMRWKALAMEKAYYAHARAARNTEGDAKQKAILSSARTLYVKEVRLFEPRPWLVGFQNGTWDRGEFREARREDHLLTLAAVAYQPDADRSDWLEVLHRITGGDADLQHTLQDVAGYALSGASSLRLLPWLYGDGGTGKGTFSEMLATVLGDMAATINPKHLATDGDRERLGAAIWGKRVALCAEAGNARLDAESLKTLSGGDRLTVRMLYAEGFTARASHVLVMVANDPPRVEAYDEALKDRVLALPFDHPLREGGPLLGGRRLEELRQDAGSALVLGFAAWAVEGLTRVHRQGDVHRAEVCRRATRDFWADVDPLRDFWATLDPADLVQGVGVTVFRKQYEDWCESVGTRPLGAQKFNKACRSVGLDSHSNGKVKGWKLYRPAAFPSLADQPEAEGGLTTLTTLTPFSQESNSLPLREREEKDSWENAPEMVKTVSSGRVPSATGWVGDDL